MLTPRARISAFAVAWVALAAAMLLVTPREFDRIRTARASAYRSDCHEAPHGAADEYVPGPVIDTGDDRARDASTAGRAATAILTRPVRLAQPSPGPAAPQWRAVASIGVRSSPLPPGRAPPRHSWSAA